MQITVNCTRPKYVCSNEKVKLYGTTDGYFPDFGHHLEGEMGGLWLYPVKLLDGFWMKLRDHQEPAVDGYIHADSFSSYPHKNVFQYGNSMGHTPIRVCRTQLAPEGIAGILVSYRFQNTGTAPRDITAELMFRTDLRPCWLSEQAGLLDGKEDVICYDGGNAVFTARDCDHDWYVMAGCDKAPQKTRQGQFFGPEITKGNGVSGEFSYELHLEPGESQTITFRAAGSIRSLEDCSAQYELLCRPADYEKEKKRHIDELCSRTRLRTQDGQFDEIFDWIKVHMDWLTLDCPAVGRGVVAGLPEYPWWFGCDSFYFLQGLITLGDYDLCRSTLKIILDESIRLNGNGRIIHEILPNNVSPNLGNTQETALFIVALWDYYSWTGDREFLEYAFPYAEKSAAWLKEADEDGDYFPSGYGIIEIAGLNMEMIDTAVYTCAAWKRFAQICSVLERDGGESWLRLSEEAAKAINTGLWNEEQGLYCDCYASYDKIASRKDVILGQVPDDDGDGNVMREYLERILEERKGLGNAECGWLLNQNWVINTPMEMGIAEEAKAKRALETMHGSRFIGPYGMYLDALRGSSTMTISTGVMAAAQARYGYPDRALELIRRMFSTFSAAMPGSISEMSPDYGCMVQAWTVYGAAVPIVRYFFGIQPEAAEHCIYIRPCPPKGWTNVSLERVRVLDGELSMTLTEDENGSRRGTVSYTGTALVIIDGDWKERIRLIRP